MGQRISEARVAWRFSDNHSNQEYADKVSDAQIIVRGLASMMEHRFACTISAAPLWNPHKANPWLSKMLRFPLRQNNSEISLGITNANLNEERIIYLDANPLVPPNGGTNANVNLTGFNYDNTDFSSLPFRTDFVAYFKDGYREYRSSEGAGGWTSATSNYGVYASSASSGNTREVAIPWNAITRSGIPSSFDFFGFLTSSGGYVYGEKCMCAELDALKCEAVRVIREVKKIRRSRDVSFHEDAELNREKHKSINAVLKHLLVGHEGKPCPAGERPIVSPSKLRG